MEEKCLIDTWRGHGVEPGVLLHKSLADRSPIAIVLRHVGLNLTVAVRAIIRKSERIALDWTADSESLNVDTIIGIYKDAITSGQLHQCQVPW